MAQPGCITNDNDFDRLFCRVITESRTAKTEARSSLRRHPIKKQKLDLSLSVSVSVEVRNSLYLFVFTETLEIHRELASYLIAAYRCSVLPDRSSIIYISWRLDLGLQEREREREEILGLYIFSMGEANGTTTTTTNADHQQDGMMPSSSKPRNTMTDADADAADDAERAYIGKISAPLIAIVIGFGVMFLFLAKSETVRRDKTILFGYSAAAFVISIFVVCHLLDYGRPWFRRRNAAANNNTRVHPSVSSQLPPQMDMC